MRHAGRVALGALIVASASSAQAATALQTTASARQAEVGEGIRIEVSALSDSDDSPTNPRLSTPPGFTVQGPSVSSSQQISFANGHFEHRRGITATWLVVGSHPGRYVIGPATVEVGRSVVRGERIDVEIVAQGSGTPRPSRRRGLFDPMNPFDPFSMLPNLPGMGDLDDQPLLQGPTDAPSEFITPHAPEPMAFLRATATPTRVVVGEQVTLNVYAYAARGPYDEVNSAEPSRADFLSQSIVDSSFKQPRYVVPIDDTRFTVVKLREVALFPLKAGELTIGPMRLGFRGPGYPETSTGSGLTRQSAPLTVTAVEPPLAGRPPGYELGDVGTYTMSAEVEPRRVEVGDAVSVTIRLEGTGNVPHHVKVPEQHGVDWLDPTITDSVTANDAVVQGFRVFRYVVRLEEAGTPNLGDVTLPYYDPRAGRYEVARARLGTVQVLPGKTAAVTPTPSGAPSAGAQAPPRDPFEGLGPVRRTLGAEATPPRHLSDQPAFWALLVGAPAGIAALRGLAELWRRIAERMRARSESGAARAGAAMSEARAAAGKRDVAGVASAIERALYTVIEDRLGLKARAVLRPDLPTALERRGADATLATDVTSVLDACDALRFTATAEASPESLIERGTAIVSRLSRISPRAEGAS